jgi:hypothetical protein
MTFSLVLDTLVKDSPHKLELAFINKVGHFLRSSTVHDREVLVKCLHIIKDRIKIDRVCEEEKIIEVAE